jgi:hypothetical protein
MVIQSERYFKEYGEFANSFKKVFLEREGKIQVIKVPVRCGKTYHSEMFLASYLN